MHFSLGVKNAYIGTPEALGHMVLVHKIYPDTVLTKH